MKLLKILLIYSVGVATPIGAFAANNHLVKSQCAEAYDVYACDVLFVYRPRGAR